MTQRIDATSWTGLPPYGAVQDVRVAQSPVSKPQALTPKSYYKRIINWSDPMCLAPVAVAAAWVMSIDTQQFAKIALVLVTATFLPSLIKWIARSLRGGGPAILLNDQGLHLPFDYVGPIPWSKIGSISYTYGRTVGWISIALDSSHGAQPRLPWPMKTPPRPARDKGQTLQIISCWETKAKGDQLIDTLAAFRDNYCGKAPSE